MPKFKKQILPEGRYLVNGNTGRKIAEFTADKLNTISETTNKMIEAGLRIPTPFKHLKKAVPKNQQELTDIPDDDSYDNGGYWEKFWTEKDENGKVSLYGEVDAPGSIEDFNSPAGKLQNTVKEISACIKDEWTDGVGRKWGPCILHGAAVVHPVVPNQKGFELVEDAVALSMSGIVEPISTVDIATLSAELAESSNIYLPPETLLEDLPNVLMVSLRQKKMLSKEEEDSDEEIVNTDPIYMSLGNIEMPITKKEAEHLLELGAINPKTNKPFTLEEFTLKADPRDALNLALTKNVLTQKKSNLKNRVETCIKEKKVTKDFAEKSLFPKIDSYDLSLAEGGVIKDQEIDGVISFIESSSPSSSAPSKENEDVIHEDDDVNLSLSEEDANKMVKEMLSYMD